MKSEYTGESKGISIKSLLSKKSDGSKKAEWPFRYWHYLQNTDRKKKLSQVDTVKALREKRRNPRERNTN